MTRGTDLVRLAVQIKSGAPLTAMLHPPPDSTLPSAHWMEKLRQALRPMPGTSDSFGACLGGSLAEVAAHLVQHHTLWLGLKSSTAAQDRQIALSFRDLIDEAADFSCGRYWNSSLLEEEETAPGSGPLTVSLNMEAVSSDSLPGESHAPPSIFQIEFAMSHANAGLGGEGLLFTIAGLQAPLTPVTKRTLVLVDSWADVPAALMEVDAWLQDPRDSARSPLDLSPLVAAAEDRSLAPTLSESKMISCTIRCAGSGRLQWPGTLFKTTVMEVHPEGAWMQAWQAEPGGEVNPGTLRQWRFSLEVTSLKLTAVTASVFVVYNYPPLRQPRPFRSSPPVLSRKNAMANLPQAFAAYKLICTQKSLQTMLETPLHIEVWQRDAYVKDRLIGLAEVVPGPVVDQLPHRLECHPGSAGVVRMLDEVHLVASALEADGTEPLQGIGFLRVQVFLEDLGPLQTPLKTEALPEAGGGEAEPQGPVLQLALEHLQALRSSPSYAAAYALEQWRQEEEETFKHRMEQLEAAERDRLEEEYRQTEMQRAQEFRVRKSEIADLQAKSKRKALELQSREAALSADYQRVKMLEDDATKRVSLIIQELGDEVRQKATELKQSLVLEEERAERLEAKVKRLEEDLTSLQCQSSDLQGELNSWRRRQESDAADLVQVQMELVKTHSQLREAESQAKVLASSRDHFRTKVEELCRRALALEEVLEVTATAVPAESRAAPVAATAPPCRAALPARLEDMLIRDARMAWLQQQRQELLGSGLYSESDPAIQALHSTMQELQMSPD